MRKTFKVQLKPNNKQASKLFLTAAAARYTYNWALEQENSNYAVGKSFIKESDLRKQFTQFKKTPEFPEKFKTVSNEAMKQAIRDAIKAYIRFFKRKAGHPQFKSARKTKPSFYQETNKIQFTETHVQIECLANSKKRNRRRLNWVRLVEHGRIPTDAKYYNPRITYDGLHWWITVAVDFPDDIGAQCSSDGVGIDLGVKDFAIVSDGTVYPNLNKTKQLKKLERHKRHLQRVVSRKYHQNNPQIKNPKKGERYRTSKNTIKAKRRHLKASRRITNILREYCKQFVKTVVSKRPKFVCMENLGVKNMMQNHNLAKAIQEQRWYLTRSTMQQACVAYQIPFVLANRRYPSSKRCIKCHYIKRNLTLKDRTYICDSCGNVIDRDKQAALNLLEYGEINYAPVV